MFRTLSVILLLLIWELSVYIFWLIKGAHVVPCFLCPKFPVHLLWLFFRLLFWYTWMCGGSEAFQAQYIGPECFTFRKDNLLQNCWDTLYFSVLISAFCKAMGSRRPPWKAMLHPSPQGIVVGVCAYAQRHEGTFVSAIFLCCLTFIFPLITGQHQPVQHCPGGGGKEGVRVFPWVRIRVMKGRQKGKCPNYLLQKIVLENRIL